MPQAAAAGSLGIPRRTWQIWLAKGREPGAAGIYAQMADAVEEALDRFHMSRAVIVGESADDRTALEVLRRRFKDDWADPERGGTTVNVQVTLEVERRELSARLLEAATRVLAGDPALLERFAAELGGGEVVDGEARELPAGATA